MAYPMRAAHPMGEQVEPDRKALASAVETAIELDTFGGKVTVEWDTTAAVTPMGQLPFFIQFLKVGDRLDPFIDQCPLYYKSNNAPKKRDVIGSLLLSILAGHNRYTHLGQLRGDVINSRLLDMSKVVSDCSAIRALLRMDEDQAVRWLQQHMQRSYEPLLTTPWIMDVDVTVKPLYGHQEGAKVGYNHHKPGRPSHTYHTYIMGNTRLVLEVNVQPGNCSSSADSLPGLVELLSRLPVSHRPQFVRGDCAWGNEPVMETLEEMDVDYLAKLKKSRKVQGLITRMHGQGQWQRYDDEWEVKASTIRLQGWSRSRRVILSRRRLFKDREAMIGYQKGVQMELQFVEPAEDVRLFEYSVLVTSLPHEPITLFKLYRDWADCENNFDEIKNQWGWGGYTTQKLKTSQMMARLVALVYNWWNLFVRLAIPHKHHEAISSRPLFLNGVGRLTESGRQKRLILNSAHAEIGKIQVAVQRVSNFFDELKSTAAQLTSDERWRRIVVKAMEFFMAQKTPPPLLEPG